MGPTDTLAWCIDFNDEGVPQTVTYYYTVHFIYGDQTENWDPTLTIDPRGDGPGGRKKHNLCRRICNRIRRWLLGG